MFIFGDSSHKKQGFSDYLAASYSRSKNLWKPEDPEYHWLFKWDGMWS